MLDGSQSRRDFLPSFQSQGASLVEAENVSENPVLSFFKDDSKLDALTLKELLEKASEDAELIQAVLQKFGKVLREEELLLLARHNSDFALELAKNAKSYNLTAGHLWSLGLFHENVVDYLLDPIRLTQFLEALAKEHLFIHNWFHHPNLPRKILNRPDILDVLKSSAVAELATNLEIANELFHNPELRKRLDLTGLCVVASLYPSLTKEVLEDKELREKLKPMDLFFLGSNLTGAKIILSSEVLRKRLTDFEYYGILSRNFELVPTMLKKISSKLNLAFLASGNENVCNYILYNFGSQLEGGDLCLLVLKKPQLALNVVKFFSAKLDDDDCLKIGDESENEEAALAIIADKLLVKKCSSLTLAKLGAKHYKVAQKIFSNPELLSKLTDFDYQILVKKGHIGTIKQVSASYSSKDSEKKEETIIRPGTLSSLGVAHSRIGTKLKSGVEKINEVSKRTLELSSGIKDIALDLLKASAQPSKAPRI